MKEIGEKLKEARENIGVSIEEVAEDLKIDVKQINDIEDGNVEEFKDIFNLKYFISDYAKYLGLDKEEIVDDFNEYLFDYTSKLSIEDIKKETKMKKEAELKIQSPYTIERKNEKVLQRAAYISIFLLFIIIIYILYVMVFDNKKDNDDVIYGGYYELTQ